MQSRLATCRRRAPVAVLVCLVHIGIAAAQTQPCTKTFTNSGLDAGLSWHVDENWSPVGVPGPRDVACILEKGNYQVTVSEPVTVAGLQIDVLQGNPKVKIVATDFTLNGFAYLAGNTKLKVNDGAVLRSDSGGMIEVHSTLVVEGGVVEIDVDLYGHLNWWGTGSVTGNLVTYPGSLIEVEDPELEAHLTVANGFELNGKLILSDTMSQSFAVTSGSLVNTAVGTVSTRLSGETGALTPELRAELVNHGTIYLDGLDLALVRDGSRHQNGADGAITVFEAELEIDLGGVVEVPSNFTNYGTATVASGGSIRIVGSAGLLKVPSNFTNYGTVTVAGGGSIRIIGSTGRRDSFTAVNHGTINLESGGLFQLTDAVFENPASGWVRGSGILDVVDAAGVIFDGTFSPGLSPGILTVDGSLNVGTNTSIDIEIGGQVPGSNLDRLDLTGGFGADGILDVSLIDPYHPAGGERYQVLMFDQLDGWFDDVRTPALLHMLTWNMDLGEHEVALEVVCQGTQLGIEVVADRDPVSLEHEVLYQVAVRNQSGVAATDVLVTNALPAGLSYLPELSSPECDIAGATVECTVASLAPAAAWNLVIAAAPVVTGTLDNTGWVGAWECDTDVMDDQSTATVQVIAAEPCDANYDLSVSSEDLVPAVAHIFGERADGNPDCRLANGITADDLAAIILASQ